MTLLIFFYFIVWCIFQQFLIVDLKVVNWSRQWCCGARIQSKSVRSQISLKKQSAAVNEVYDVVVYGCKTTIQTGDVWRLKITFTLKIHKRFLIKTLKEIVQQGKDGETGQLMFYLIVSESSEECLSKPFIETPVIMFPPTICCSTLPEVSL